MPEDEGGGIFVSYRRQESKDFAGRLADRLADRFGEGQVFIDVDAIEPGVDFAEEISRAVASCKVLVAVIGPKWLTAADEGGRRRLDDPDDIVRLEIEAALARDVRVIPILVEGAVMPGRDDLPESLAGLGRRNALLIRHASFRSDAGRLVTAIERVLPAAGVPAVPSAQDAHDVRSAMVSSGHLDTNLRDIKEVYIDSTARSRDGLTTEGYSADRLLGPFIGHAYAIGGALRELCTFLEEDSRPPRPAETSDYMIQEMDILWEIRKILLEDLARYENDRIITSLPHKRERTSIIDACLHELDSIRFAVKDTLGDNVRAAWQDLSNKHVSARQQQKSRAVAVRSFRNVAENWFSFAEMLSSAQDLNQHDSA